jgi:hypothetical protein
LFQSASRKYPYKIGHLAAVHDPERQVVFVGDEPAVEDGEGSDLAGGRILLCRDLSGALKLG